MLSNPGGTTPTKAISKLTKKVIVKFNS